MWGGGGTGRGTPARELEAPAVYRLGGWISSRKIIEWEDLQWPSEPRWLKSRSFLLGQVGNF
jgi:hypothetical protein